MASVLGASLQTLDGAEHTATGAALLAGSAVGVFANVPDAVACSVRYGVVEEPHPADQDVYAAGFARFQALYPALRAVKD